MSLQNPGSYSRKLDKLIHATDYTSVIFGGFTILMLLLWIPLGRNYVGPQVLMLGRETEISAQGVLKA